MTERTGSFPLMNIAQDFDVDYGDVLILMQHMRWCQIRSVFTYARWVDADTAGARVQEAIGSFGYSRLLRALVVRL